METNYNDVSEAPFSAGFIVGFMFDCKKSNVRQTLVVNIVIALMSL